MSLVFVDVESSSLAENCDIIQLAAIAVDDDGNEVEAHEWKLLFDENKADPKALELNHYDAVAWDNGGLFPEEACPLFAAMCKKFASIDMVSKRTGKPYRVARLAGYNSATFDGPRIQAMFKRMNLFLPAHPITLDVLQLALWTLPGLPDYKLGTVCEHLGIPLPGAHDALADVRATAEVARLLQQRRRIAAECEAV